MPSTFNIAPSPKWYFLDSQGRPAAGGSITTFSSLDHSTPKFIFADAAGNFPYLDPIILDGTGGSPVPMYFENNGVDLYYVVIKDAAGNIICTIDNFPPGTGGVTPINTNVDIENHIVNGAFIFIDALTSGESVISPIPAGMTRLAPAAGFFQDIDGHFTPTPTGSNFKSGWNFVKSGGAGETSTIAFVDVVGIGEGFPNSPSENATRFFQYQLSVAGAPQTDAFLSQTIPNVETFSGETLTISFDTHSDAAGVGVFEILQFFGTGGSADSAVTHNFNFSVGAWARQSFTVVVPSVVGKSKGPNRDDSINVLWSFPLNTLGSFDITNLQVQRGTFGAAPYIYQTYNQDQYKVLIDLLSYSNIIFETGALRFSLNGDPGLPEQFRGWLLLYNVLQTIGYQSASGATTFGERFVNLYILWWTLFDQTECAVNGGRGVSPTADFFANKQMTIPVSIINRVLASAGTGTATPFGTFAGENEHVLTIPEMPAHDHTIPNPINFLASSGAILIHPVDGLAFSGTTGGGLAHNNIQPTAYFWLYVKL
jgi:hypothetical protein